MKDMFALPALIGIGLLASLGAAFAEPQGPTTSGVRLVVTGQGTLGSDFRMTGLNIVYGAGPGGTAFETSMSGLQATCAEGRCAATPQEGAGWSVIQTVTACSQADACGFTSDVGSGGQD